MASYFFRDLYVLYYERSNKYEEIPLRKKSVWTRAD